MCSKRKPCSLLTEVCPSVSRLHLSKECHHSPVMSPWFLSPPPLRMLPTAQRETPGPLQAPLSVRSTEPWKRGSGPHEGMHRKGRKWKSELRNCHCNLTLPQCQARGQWSHIVEDGVPLGGCCQTCMVMTLKHMLQTSHIGCHVGL